MGWEETRRHNTALKGEKVTEDGREGGTGERGTVQRSRWEGLGRGWLRKHFTARKGVNVREGQGQHNASGGGRWDGVGGKRTGQGGRIHQLSAVVPHPHHFSA